MLRRLLAVGAGLLVVILIVLGVRGCLNARKERSFENYVADLTALTTDSNSLSETFFGRLEDPGQLSPLQFEAEVKADRGAAEGLFDRARGLDAPDSLSEAQDLVELAFQLRRDALAVISDQIATAFAREGSSQATAAIAVQMRTLLASDVIYGRAQTLIDQALAVEEIPAEAPSSQFLPGTPNWLDPQTIEDALSQVSGTEAASPGVHGLGLEAATILPSGVGLEEGTTVSASAAGAELEVEVANQGESAEGDIGVSYSTDVGSGAGTIDSIGAGETGSVTIALEPAPTPGETSTITVDVDTVPGEKIADNNSATYEVAWE